MVIEDVLYGKFETEPVIEDLIKSGPFQRLKSVHQGGAIFLIDSDITLTRFEHSIGVYLLVRQMGGKTEEQIAALLHDVSHTAFSHVTDYVFANRNEDYHELIFHEVISRSEIPAVLNAHGFDISILENEHEYTILEMPVPHLCADRIDYTLRDLFHTGRISLAEVRDFLDDLVLHQNKIAVRSQEMADWITLQFKILNEAHFGKKEHVYANLKLAEILKSALSRGVIVERDIWKNDFELLELLYSDPASAGNIEDLKKLKGLETFVPEQNIFKKRELKPFVAGKK